MKAIVPIAAVALALSPLTVLHPLKISGRSMEPALRSGELRWALWPWCAGMPRRGQVWMIEGPEGPSVKRIVGLPSDRVESKEGEVYLNGSRINESYVEKVELKDAPDGVWECGDGYLLLGDNRRESHDGRAWGPLPPSSLRGRVLGAVAE